MRVRSSLFLLLVVFLVSSCKDLNELVTFRIRNEADFTVKSAVNAPLNLDLPVGNVKSNSNQAFENNNTRADLVKEVKLENLKLTITSPDNADFNNIKSIYLYINAEGLEEKLIAFKDNDDESLGNIMEMETTNEQLDEFIKKDQYSLRTEIELRRAYMYDVDVKANMTFRATANLL